MNFIVVRKCLLKQVKLDFPYEKTEFQTYIFSKFFNNVINNKYKFKKNKTKTRFFNSRLYFMTIF